MAANGQPGVGLPDHVKRGGGGGVMGTKVEDAANEGQNRAGEGIARTTMADSFTTDPVLLVREGEVDRSGGGNFGDGTGRCGQLSGAVVEHYILEAKGGAACVCIGRKGILTRPAQEEEADQGDVADGLGPGSDSLTV